MRGYVIAKNGEEVKAALEGGHLVGGDRGIGKTTALVDLVAEKHGGEAFIVTSHSALVREITKMFVERHPDKTPPRVVSALGGIKQVCGFGQPVYGDNVSLFPSIHREAWLKVMTAAIE